MAGNPLRHRFLNARLANRHSKASPAGSSKGCRSLGIFSDDGGQFQSSRAMINDNRQKTVSALNDLWQGNSIRRTRQGDGTVTLYNRMLAVHLMVQPGVARPILSDAIAIETGFLARILICEPPSTIGHRLYSAEPGRYRGLERFATRLAEILDVPLPMDPETRELEPRVLPLDPEARDLLIRFSDRTELRQAKNGAFADFTGTASKAADSGIERIAGVMTLYRDLDAPCVPAEGSWPTPSSCWSIT